MQIALFHSKSVYSEKATSKTLHYNKTSLYCRGGEPFSACVPIFSI